MDKALQGLMNYEQQQERMTQIKQQVKVQTDTQRIETMKEMSVKMHKEIQLKESYQKELVEKTEECRIQVTKCKEVEQELKILKEANTKLERDGAQEQKELIKRNQVLEKEAKRQK